MNFIKPLLATLLTFFLIIIFVTPLANSRGVFYSIKDYTPPKKPINTIRPNHELDSIGIYGCNYLDRMGSLESSHRYTVINRFGYLGKYQFHKKTLKRIGFNKQQIKKYLNDPILQEKAMIALTLYNYTYLKDKRLLKYIGKTISGTIITLEGMLAGAHLRGPAAVKKFLRSDGRINLKDANNTSVKDYIKEFESLYETKCKL